MRRLGHLFHLSVSKFTAIFSKSVSSSTVKYALVSLVLLFSLSSVRGTAASATAEGEDAIPLDAIRIRILANSDSPFDQKVKRDVRDRVAAVIESWGAMPGTREEARALIESHLDEIEQTADHALEGWGVSYRATTELSRVPFPDKTFKGRTYAAGDYEALRISLGGGQGANWWCVLFPPLCLTAAAASEDQAPAKQAADKTSASKSVKTSAKAASPITKFVSDASQGNKEADAGQPKPRFFIWELLQKLGDFLGSIFS